MSEYEKDKLVVQNEIIDMALTKQIKKGFWYTTTKFMGKKIRCLDYYHNAPTRIRYEDYLPINQRETET